MNEQVFLGVDGGGTKTRVHCINASRKSLGEIVTGCTNWNSVGDETAAANLRDGIEGVLKAASVEKNRVAGICLGMAGVDRPEDQEKLQKIVHQILPNVATKRTKIVNDGEVSLASGTDGVLEGICVISGTGTIVIGYKDGVNYRCAGWGPMLGDRGSGFNIGTDALAAVTRAHDDGTTTLLSKLILEALGLKHATELIPWAYKDTEWARFAALSRHVFEAAAMADPVALRIIDTAAQSLAANIEVVYSRANFKEVPKVDIVLAGGNLAHQLGAGILATQLKEKLTTRFPNAHVLFPSIDPSLAAALMALQLKD